MDSENSFTATPPRTLAKSVFGGAHSPQFRKKFTTRSQNSWKAARERSQKWTTVSGHTRNLCANKASSRTLGYHAYFTLLLDQAIWTGAWLWVA